MQFYVSAGVEENLGYDADVQALSKALKVVIVILHQATGSAFTSIQICLPHTSKQKINENNKREENPINNPVIYCCCVVLLFSWFVGSL